jgi:tRNA (adenine22-N1)-methyltransferase
MNVEQLSERLTRVASFVPAGARLADIGSDHAYLPCYLCLKGVVEFAIAGEVNEGPYQSAVEQVQKVNLGHVISVRKGDGLAVIRADDQIDTVTIAGMGGTLISTILGEGKRNLQTVRRLILQPNVHAKAIRQWLSDNGWRLQAEAILEEDEKIYELLIAERGSDEDLYVSKELDLLVGPYLRKERNAAFQKKWTGELTSWKRVLSQLNKAKPSEELEAKKIELQKNISLIEEVLR